MDRMGNLFFLRFSPILSIPLPLESYPRKPNYKLSNFESKGGVNIKSNINPAL